MGRGRVPASIAVALTVVLVASTAALATMKLPSAGSAAEVKKLVAASTSISKLSSAVTKELPEAADDSAGVLYPWTKDGCTLLTQCVFGDTKSKKQLFIMGDSHAQMWIPALNRIGITHKLKVVVLFLALCPAASLDVWLTVYNEAYTSCTTQRSTWIAELDQLKPADILLTERTYGVYSAASDGTETFTNAQWEAGLETTITGLKASGAKIAVLGDIVALSQAPASCLAAYPTSVQSCSVPNPNTAKPNHQSAEQAAAKAEGSLFVNPVPWLCTKTACSVVIGSYIAYYDEYHLSCQYAAFLSGVLQTALKKIL